jgi:hypothetical protein
MNIVSHNLFKRINAKAAPKQHTMVIVNVSSHVQR